MALAIPTRRLVLRVLLGVALAVGALAAVTTPQSVKAQSGAAVTISGFAFHDSTVTIAPGTAVTWTNQDSASHTATSDPNSAVQWDSGSLATGKSFSFTFTKAGTYPYHCSFHPSMHGTIIVKAAVVAPAKKVIRASSVNGHFVFSAKKVTIHVGTKVMWQNTTTGVAHTVTSTTAKWKFDKILAPGKSLSYTFKKTGTYHYLCKYHPGMVGTIIVKA